MSNTSPQPNTPSIKDKIMQQVESGAVCPRSKSWFACIEGLIWLLWGATVLFGAISIAIFSSAFVKRSRDIFEATHASPFEFFVSVLPFIWIGVFALMTALAWYNLRCTKRGYRYPALHIIGSSLLFTIAGGMVLHFAGVGELLDRELGKRMPMYMSQDKMELKLWQAPEEGRLVGMLATSTGETKAIFTDLQGTTWALNLTELREPDRIRLFSNEKVRVLGVPAIGTTTLYACGVFPWMFDRTMPPAKISQEREAFVERMYAFKDEKDRLEGLQLAAREGREMGKCAELKIIERISETMR